MTHSHATLAQLVADSLRDSIRAGFFPCGERLIELAIAQSQNVSQNTVRDALRQLEAEGWVRYEARRGVRVRRFDAAEAEEIFALLATIEQLALGWAFIDLKRSPLLAALSPALVQARHEHDAGNVASRRGALFGFHAAIAALTRHTYTQSLLGVLHNQAYLLTTDYETRADSHAHHAVQIDAYEHLLGVLKFGSSTEAGAALHTRILADGKPIVRWLAMHG